MKNYFTDYQILAACDILKHIKYKLGNRQGGIRLFDRTYGDRIKWWHMAILGVVLFLSYLVVLPSAAEAVVRPGTNNNMLCGVWLGQNADESLEQPLSYYEFCEDGTGYVTSVSYNTDTQEFYYTDADITKIQSWSYRDGFGIEYTRLDNDKLVLIRLSSAASWTINFLDDESFSLKGWDNEILFQKLDSSLLTAEQKSSVS